MGDLPSHPDTDHTGTGPDRGPTTGTPGWVTMAGITMAIVVVVALVVLHLTGVLGPAAH